MRYPISLSMYALLAGGIPQSKPAPSDLSSRLSKEVLPKSAAQKNWRQVDSKKFAKKADTKHVQAIADGLAWLASHQSMQGYWSSDAFSACCPVKDTCSGKGMTYNRVSVTGLALMALMGNGSTHKQGRYQHEIKEGALWLISNMGKDGLIEQQVTLTYFYSHVIATTALVELAGLSGSKILRGHAQKAVDYILASRNPYRVWRYYPRDGHNDSSVTGFAVTALTSAKAFGFDVDKVVFRYSLAWYDKVTDVKTGQVGYGNVAEVRDPADRWTQSCPATSPEALISLALSSRLLLGQDPIKTPVMRIMAKRLLKSTPKWTKDGGVDYFYWYFGTFCCYQMGDRYWRGWKWHIKRHLLKNQAKKGHALGSWKPVGVWGKFGGRIASTALAVMCLQVEYNRAELARK